MIGLVFAMLDLDSLVFVLAELVVLVAWSFLDYLLHLPVVVAWLVVLPLVVLPLGVLLVVVPVVLVPKPLVVLLVLAAVRVACAPVVDPLVVLEIH